MAEIRKDWRFWLAIAAFLLAHMSIDPSYYNVTPHMLDTGYSTMTVTGLMMVILLICNAGAKPVMGLLNDRFGVIVVCSLTCILSAIGSIMMAFLHAGQIWYGILCVILIGSGTPITTITIPLFLTHVFGSREYGTVMGITLAFGYVGTTVGRPLSNYLFDITGSYNLSYQLNTIFLAVALIMFIIILTSSKTRNTTFR